MYKIEIKKTAQKDLDALDDKTYSRIDRSIQDLKERIISTEFDKEIIEYFMRSTKKAN